MTAQIDFLSSLKAASTHLGGHPDAPLTLCHLQITTLENLDRTCVERAVAERLAKPSTDGWLRRLSRWLAPQRSANSGSNGWILRQSGVVLIEDGQGDDPSLGPPIEAQWYAAGGSGSWALELTTPGRWVLRSFEEGGVEGSGTPLLAENVKILGAHGVKELGYRLYWAEPADDPGAIRRHACRLISIVPSDDCEAAP